VLQPSDYAPALAEAYSTMQPIDEDDTPFLAAAIHLNCPIWSNDQDFARQKRVQVYTTFQLAKILKIVRS